LRADVRPLVGATPLGPTDRRQRLGALPGVETGPYEVSLSGLAPNCSFASPNPQWADVGYRRTTDIDFAVECVATGSLTLNTTTSGVDLDPDGYSVAWSGAVQGGTVVVPANGTASISGSSPACTS